MMTPVARRSYTDAEKAEALALYETEGLAAAHAATGVPKATLCDWARANGVRTFGTQEKTAAATEARQRSIETRKADLAIGLLDDIERLRAQLFAPCVERKVVTLSGGKEMSSTWDIVDVETDRPAFTDQRAIMTSVAIAVDKVQILTGDVTARTETIGGDREQVKERLGRVVEAQALRLVS